MTSTALPGEERHVDNVPQAFAALVAAEAPSSIALSGGETARECYELLATADVDWRGVDVWFGDERFVPIHDPESNEGMARVTFLDEVEPHSIHSLYGAGDTIEAAAAAYEDALRDAPPIALVHLGMGPDGHTASLFPGSASLDVTDRLVIPAGDDLHPHPRLTFTFPQLARCELAVITVAGAEKHEALERVRAGEDLPVARVGATRIVWLVDRAAANGA
jgi:6-phosphogluconolactonase